MHVGCGGITRRWPLVIFFTLQGGFAPWPLRPLATLRVNQNQQYLFSSKSLFCLHPPTMYICSIKYRIYRCQIIFSRKWWKWFGNFFDIFSFLKILVLVITWFFLRQQIEFFFLVRGESDGFYVVEYSGKLFPMCWMKLLYPSALSRDCDSL